MKNTYLPRQISIDRLDVAGFSSIQATVFDLALRAAKEVWLDGVSLDPARPVCGRNQSLFLARSQNLRRGRKYLSLVAWSLMAPTPSTKTEKHCVTATTKFTLKIDFLEGRKNHPIVSLIRAA